MDIWDKILAARVKDKEKYTKLFPEIIEYVLFKKQDFDDNVEDKDFYYLVTEENRANSIFVHIVPKELMSLFREIQIKAPNEFLGYSVLIGRRKNREVRVSCFGVPCSILAKSIADNKIVKDVRQENIKNVCLGIVFDSRERLLMIKRSLDPYKGFWAFPGGVVNQDEEVANAVKRIIKLETGINVEIVKETLLLDKFDRKNKKNILIHYVLCVALSDSTSLGDNIEDVRWFSKQDLLTINIIPEFKKYVLDEVF